MADPTPKISQELVKNTDLSQDQIEAKRAISAKTRGIIGEMTGLEPVIFDKYVEENNARAKASGKKEIPVEMATMGDLTTEQQREIAKIVLMSAGLTVETVIDQESDNIALEMRGLAVGMSDINTGETKISYQGSDFEVKELPSEENKDKYVLVHPTGKPIYKLSVDQLIKQIEDGNAKLVPPEPEKKFTDYPQQDGTIMRIYSDGSGMRLDGEKTTHYWDTKGVGKPTELDLAVERLLRPGKDEKVPSSSTLNARIGSLPAELRTQVLNNEKVLKTYVNAVIQKEKEDGLKSLTTMKSRLEYTPEEIRGKVMQDPEVRQFMIDKILQKGEERPSFHAAQIRLDNLPQEIRAEIAANDEVHGIFPNLVVKKDEKKPDTFAISPLKKPTQGPEPAPEVKKIKLERDPMYAEALRLASTIGEMSTAILQRILRLGYERAARIKEMMQADKIIQPDERTELGKPNKIILTEEEIENFIKTHEFVQTEPPEEVSGEITKIEKITKMAQEIVDEQLELALDELAQKNDMTEEEKEETRNSKLYNRKRAEMVAALVEQFKNN